MNDSDVDTCTSWSASTPASPQKPPFAVKYASKYECKYLCKYGSYGPRYPDHRNNNSKRYKRGEAAEKETSSPTPNTTARQTPPDARRDGGRSTAASRPPPPREREREQQEDDSILDLGTFLNHPRAPPTEWPRITDESTIYDAVKGFVMHDAEQYHGHNEDDDENFYRRFIGYFNSVLAPRRGFPPNSIPPDAFERAVVKYLAEG